MGRHKSKVFKKFGILHKINEFVDTLQNLEKWR